MAGPPRKKGPAVASRLLASLRPLDADGVHDWRTFLARRATVANMTEVLERCPTLREMFDRGKGYTLAGDPAPLHSNIRLEFAEALYQTVRRQRPRIAIEVGMAGWHTFDHTLLAWWYVDKMLPAGGIVGFNDCDWQPWRRPSVSC